MVTVTPTALRQNLYAYLEQVVQYDERVNVATKNGGAIIISEEEYRSLLETMHLYSLPGMVESILQAKAEPLEACVPLDEVDVDAL